MNIQRVNVYSLVISGPDPERPGRRFAYWQTVDTLDESAANAQLLARIRKQPGTKHAVGTKPPRLPRGFVAVDGQRKNAPRAPHSYRVGIDDA